MGIIELTDIEIINEGLCAPTGCFSHYNTILKTDMVVFEWNYHDQGNMRWRAYANYDDGLMKFLEADEYNKWRRHTFTYPRHKMFECELSDPGLIEKLQDFISARLKDLRERQRWM